MNEEGFLRLIAALDQDDVAGLRREMDLDALSWEQGERALTRAAYAGSAGCAGELLGFVDPSRERFEALEWAAQNGNDECVKLLMRVGDPKANHSYALQLAAAKGHEGCVRLLAGASDAKAQSSAALRTAACHGHGGCVALLLEAGADARARSDGGLDACAEARGSGFLEIAAMIEAFEEAKALRSRAKKAEPKGPRAL